MHDTPTSQPPAAAGELRDQLAAAWRSVDPSAAPSTDWLDAASVALAATAAPPPHDHHDGLDPATCQHTAVAALAELRAATGAALRAAAERRDQLTTLQARVRQRAIDQLADSPELAGSLHDALEAWGLPPVPTEHTVHLAVRLAVRVVATDAADARAEAAATLASLLVGGGPTVRADLAGADYLDVTSP
jgi:hypothetical protein